MRGQPKVSFAAAFTAIVCILGLGAVISLQQTAQMQLSEATSETGSRFVAEQSPQSTRQMLNSHWVVDAVTAKQLLDQGATLLDARGMIMPGNYLHGAVPVSWQQFSQENPPHRGKLLEDDRALTEKLQEVGVFQDRPVVVVADPTNGWGEEGRIVWMLRTLGHPQAVMVDGGYQALHKAGVPTQLVASPVSHPGDFVVNRISAWEIQRDELQASLNQSNLVIIDAREQNEYEGATLYGEARGGHLPGAVHLHYEDFLDDQGKILPRSEIRQILRASGISDSEQVVSYCTGGIRSAWLTAILSDLGFDAKNYAGSIWEWAAAPAAEFPLVGSEEWRVRSEENAP
ncbi:sulfurtransferase [Egbenema bharatensis]|uniref:sulfurtransferase n=1 Tax=Egbenema bharatensis TaxID=3463334 RepID=UPI003A89D0F7